jgi:hypothetical protein
MLATFAGPPELETTVGAADPPHAARVVAIATRIIGNRFMLLLPNLFLKPAIKTLPEL